MGNIFGISDILNAVFNRDANKLKVETDLQIFVRKSTDPFPEGKEGDSLYLWDTKQVFLHDGTTWREL